jgi:uncharacterized protein
MSSTTSERMLSFNVAELLRSTPGTIEHIPVAVSDIELADGVELARPVRGDLRLQHSGRSILVSAHFDTALAEPCSRCLRAAESRVSIDLDEEALPSVDLDSGALIDKDEEPDLMRLTDRHELDLEPVVRDAISLAEPIAPLCRANCPGLCETCGVDLTDHPGHAHDDVEIDPRLAALAGIRERLQ